MSLQFRYCKIRLFIALLLLTGILLLQDHKHTRQGARGRHPTTLEKFFKIIPTRAKFCCWAKMLVNNWACVGQPSPRFFFPYVYASDLDVSKIAMQFYYLCVIFLAVCTNGIRFCECQQSATDCIRLAADGRSYGSET